MDELLEFMKKTDSYKERATKVEHKQTHISHIFLIDNHVYKIKKPVDFGFLDFTTLEKRKHFCEEELRLNRRLCRDIYLEVLPITRTDDGLSIGGEGEAVEYAIKMKRMPEEAIMTRQLENDRVENEDIKMLANTLVDFYSNARRDEEVRSFGRMEEIRKLTDQNFRQTEKYVGTVFDRESYDYIKDATNRFLENKEGLFQRRLDEDRIVEYHGDLHSGNIFLLPGKACIFDCIEFNLAFRCGDIAADIGFLAMDLDYKEKDYLAKYFISKYVDLSEDYSFYLVYDFYKCYRAYVRAKVTAFMLDDPAVSEQDKAIAKEKARRYIDLAKIYSMTFNNQKPLLMIATGITATGKSKWLKIACDIVNSSMLRSDAVRRKLFKLTGEERKDKRYYEKYYTEEKKKRVYDKIYKEVERVLAFGGKIAFDAAFHTKEMRKRAADIARRYNAEFIIIHTHASEDTTKDRIRKRKREKDNISDSNIKDSLKFFKENYEAPGEDEGNLIDLDTEEDEFQTLKKLRKALLDTIERD